MVQKYKIEGMHCGSCVAKVEGALAELDSVEEVKVSLQEMSASIKFTTPIDTSILGKKVSQAGYELNEDNSQVMTPVANERSWFQTYFPLLLIFTFISGISILHQLTSSSFLIDDVMRHFMAGFFLVFSFFKFLNLKAFSKAYSGYDIVAKQWKAYGLIYPFIELALGILYLINYNPLITNTITLFVMGVSTIGVVESLMNKRQIQCACLGAVFDLPMSTVTLIEDLLMVAMAAFMLLKLI